MNAQSEWKLHSTENNTKLWVKTLDETGLKEFKIQSVIKGSLESAYLLLRDVENMNLWYDKVKSVQLLKRINDHEAIYFLEYDIPFPFSNRISTIRGKITYNKNEKTIDITTDFHPYAVPLDKQDLLLITKIAGSWKIKQLENGNLHIQHTGYMNPGGNLPIWLVNEGITSGPFKTLKGFKDQLGRG